MRRRTFIAGLAGMASGPFGARAAEASVVGFLNGGLSKGYAPLAASFVKGLGETGFVEGRDVRIEYRWAEDHNEQLPRLAAELVQLKVAVIAATSTPAALAAKAATSTVPIVFETSSDPVALGLVASLSRPDGNVTGVTQLSVETAPKRLELLHELFPDMRAVGLLVNPDNPAVAAAASREMTEAAKRYGLELHVLKANSDAAFDAVFAEAHELHLGGVATTGGDAFFLSRTAQMAALAAKHAVPTVGSNRSFVDAGGLLSYGGDIVDAYRLTGTYVGRILRGEKPADLPVQQTTKVELRINMKAAKALGVTVPLTLLGRADEVIE
jgi:putative tryptophan/tyrosine transport system substrate-binding protein